MTKELDARMDTMGDLVDSRTAPALVADSIHHMVITMQTFVMSDCILYTVCDGDSTLGDHGSAREVWRKEVPLMQTEAYRAGGYHVTAAAREQEFVAMELARRYAEGRR